MSAAADLTGYPIPRAARFGRIVITTACIVPLAGGGDGIAGSAFGLGGGVAP